MLDGGCLSSRPPDETGHACALSVLRHAACVRACASMSARADQRVAIDRFGGGERASRSVNMIANDKMSTWVC